MKDTIQKRKREKPALKPAAWSVGRYVRVSESVLRGFRSIKDYSGYRNNRMIAWVSGGEGKIRVSELYPVFARWSRATVRERDIKRKLRRDDPKGRFYQLFTVKGIDYVKALSHKRILKDSGLKVKSVDYYKIRADELQSIGVFRRACFIGCLCKYNVVSVSNFSERLKVSRRTAFHYLEEIERRKQWMPLAGPFFKKSKAVRVLWEARAYSLESGFRWIDVVPIEREGKRTLYYVCRCIGVHVVRPAWYRRRFGYVQGEHNGKSVLTEFQPGLFGGFRRKHRGRKDSDKAIALVRRMYARLKGKDWFIPKDDELYPSAVFQLG